MESKFPRSSFKPRVWDGVFLVIFCFACASPKKLIQRSDPDQGQAKKSLMPPEMKLSRDRLKLVQNPSLSHYLDDCGKKVWSAIMPKKDARLHIGLFKNPLEIWQNYSFSSKLDGSPEVFISVGLLKRLRFESELAGLIALELIRFRESVDLARQAEGGLVIHGRLDPNSVSTSPRREVRTGTVEEDWKSHEIGLFRAAVRALYHSGYDPRALCSLIEIYKTNSAVSPFDLAFLDQLAEEVRTEIAIYPPLRNPIIQTNRFLVLQERIQKL